MSVPLEPPHFAPEITVERKYVHISEIVQMTAYTDRLRGYQVIASNEGWVLVGPCGDSHYEFVRNRTPWKTP